MKSPDRNATYLSGFTLVEILVALGLITITIVFAAVAFTQSQRALTHARQVQDTMLYGQGLIDEIEAAPPSPAVLPMTDIDKKIVIGARECLVTRSISFLESKGAYSLERITVTINWDGCSRPVIITHDILLK